MSTNQLLKRVFPETQGQTSKEDGVGIYRSPKAQEQYEARKAAQARKKKKAQARKKSRRVVINIRQVVIVQPEIVIMHPPVQCTCGYDAKADVEAFENNPYWMHYRRPTLPIGRNPA
jgi:hypothetical protein